VFHHLRIESPILAISQACIITIWWRRGARTSQAIADQKTLALGWYLPRKMPKGARKCQSSHFQVLASCKELQYKFCEINHEAIILYKKTSTTISGIVLKVSCVLANTDRSSYRGI
jgi:hypothetical protein